MTKLKFLLGQWLANLTRKLRNNFYLYLAALLTLAVLLDAGVFHVGENMRDKAFDFMVRQRVIVPAPDKDIVIVDVNEKSLAAMAGEYGRWPWPRQVFGEFLENIEAQKPKAIVFDILFSDSDVFNPGGIFRTLMQSPEGQKFPGTGCYLEVIPNERLVWTNALEPGFRPAKQPEENPGLECAELVFTAVISLEPHANGTKYIALVMHATQETRIKHEKMSFREGWGVALDQLVEMIKKG